MHSLLFSSEKHKLIVWPCRYKKMDTCISPCRKCKLRKKLLAELLRNGGSVASDGRGELFLPLIHILSSTSSSLRSDPHFIYFLFDLAQQQALDSIDDQEPPSWRGGHRQVRPRPWHKEVSLFFRCYTLACLPSFYFTWLWNQTSRAGRWFTPCLLAWCHSTPASFFLV